MRVRLIEFASLRHGLRPKPLPQDHKFALKSSQDTASLCNSFVLIKSTFTLHCLLQSMLASWTVNVASTSNSLCRLKLASSNARAISQLLNKTYTVTWQHRTAHERTSSVVQWNPNPSEDLREFLNKKSSATHAIPQFFCGWLMAAILAECRSCTIVTNWFVLS